MQPSWTGGGGNHNRFQQQYAPQPQQPSGYMAAQPTGYGGGYQQPAMLQPQYTAYPQQQQQQQQMTGSMMQMQPMPQQLGSFQGVPSVFSNAFMPGMNNLAAGGGGGNLPQVFAQQNMATYGQTQVNVQWALTEDEKKSYSQIFRNWQDDRGFISGSRAQQVFKESGLDREDLMKIWALSDVGDRGQLDLPEFQVAMGLIYRKLSGNPIPDVLPQEMVPPSSRDLESSVDFLKDLLRNDTRSRSTNLDPSQSNGSSTNNKYAKVRSFDRNASPEPSTTRGNRKDAAVYKHDDSEIKTYKPNSRHLDRRNVRFHGEDDDNSDLGSLKKQLRDTQDLLDRTYKSKGDDDDDDDDLVAEIDDLKYRIRRVQEDIEFNKSGRRTEAKDDERRRLERELLFLMHEKMPELEDKMREKERRRRDRDRGAAKQRDSRNNRSKYDRYSSRDSSNRDSSGSDEDEQEDRGYLRGSYGASSSRQSERVRSPPSRSERDNRDSSRDRYSNDREEPNRQARAPSPPPAPPAGASAPRSPPPAPPAPATAAPAPQQKKPQTPEERQAFIRAEAQRRVQERMRMLTGQSPTASPEPTDTLPSGYDSSLQARLEQDRREAAKRAEDDDRAASERERLRQIKLEEERQSKLKAAQSTIQDEAEALQKVSNEVTASEVKNHVENEEIATTAARDELACEENLNREREQALATQQKESQARMEQLKAGFQQKPKTPPQPPASRGHKAPPKPPPSRKQAPPPPASHSASTVTSPGETNASTSTPSAVPQAPPPPPPAPPAPASNVTPSKAASPAPKTTSSTNPFHRLAGSSGALAGQSPSPSTAPKGANNPFFRPPTGAATTANPPPLAEPVPQKPPAARKEDDWGDVSQRKQADSDDSDDDDEGGPSVKQMRAGLAGLLFGGSSNSPSAPSSRPGSARPELSPTSAAPRSQAPALPPLGAAAGSPPPRAALLGAIQSGARLRKATTNDRSIVQGAGHILDTPGAAANTERSEEETNASKPKGPSPIMSDSQSVPPPDSLSSSTPAAKGNRQSVDWYGGLAADHYPSPPVQSSSESMLPKVAEDAEEHSSDDDDADNAKASQLQPHDATEVPSTTGDPNADDDTTALFDMTASTKMRSLYAYQGQRNQDASFEANLLVVAHPAKDPDSDWLYGIVPATGSRGWLPKTYVEELAFNIPSTVLYDFEGATEDELKVTAGTHVFVCEKVDTDWVRVVLNGRVGLVPSAYIEEDNKHAQNESKNLSQHDKADNSIFTQSEASSPSDEESEEEPDQIKEHERLHILEAAGLVIQHNTTKRAHRRPPPPRPRASSIHTFDTATNNSAQLAEDQTLTSVDDAYARWQAIQIEKNARSEHQEGSASAGATPRLSDHFEASAASPSSSDVGRTWSSLISHDALESIPEKARKRQEAIFELIKSEETFLESLQTVVREWFTKLQPLLPHEASLVVFANIEDILLWSVTFLSDLASRQKECRLYVDRIGDVLKTHSTGLDVYRPYCLNQSNAARTLASFRQQDTEVDAIAATRINGLNLEHFLLEPMQRLARYPLLFGQILRYTENDDPDVTDLKLAIRNAQQVLTRTNEQMKQQETEALLAYLSENLTFPDDESLTIDLTAPTRYGKPRRLIKEGTLVKGYNHHRQTKRKDLYAYLFSDMLLLTTKTLSLRDRFSNRLPASSADATYIYKTPIPLNELTVQSSSEERVLVLKHQGEVLKFQASSAKQKEEWQASLENAAKEFQSGKDYDPEQDDSSDGSEPLRPAKRPALFRKPSPVIEVVSSSKRARATPSAPKKQDASYAYLFGQQQLSNDWLEERGRIKDMAAALMASIRPRGGLDILGWPSSGMARLLRKP
ncbi:hypothetical protein P389DRAFT_211187 [Cystobasidium minutum MCA 4210]|uniref:uncharacterized protein n=1 Tax=Cystobasidium minutum MCA 4210 TaxID=1397322 RepID=UPI0034CD5DEC|eukprot:jgi/Rhomi1/211187/estExt_Genemark1.C_4_t20331